MLYKRPQLKIPLTIKEKILEIINIIFILGVFLILVWNYGNLPEKIPTHFGVSGQPDAWGGKLSLLFMPIMMVLMYLGLTIVGRFPHTYNYLCKITEENAPFQYLNGRILVAMLKTEIVLIFTYIQWITILVAVGKTSGLGFWFLPTTLIVIFGTLGFYTLKMFKEK